MPAFFSLRTFLSSIEQVLNLQANDLRGPIDASLFRRTTKLRELSLGANDLSGPMPLAALGLRHPEGCNQIVIILPFDDVVRPGFSCPWVQLYPMSAIS